MDSIYGIWGSYFNIPKAIFYLLKGDYKVLGFRALLAVLVYECLHVPCWTTNLSLSVKCNVVSCLCFSNDNQNQFSGATNADPREMLFVFEP